MAEMAVSFAREKLLLPLIVDEANLLWGTTKEFADIKNELEYIQAFLKDADTRAAEEEGIKTWVKELREASYRIEDVIDEYMVYVGQQPDSLGCASLLFECHITHLSNLIESLKRHHQIASEIQEVKSFVNGIKQRSKDYHLQPCVEQGQIKGVKWHDPRLHSPYLEESEVVGFEGPRDELIGWLVEGPVERIVISVVAMGGQGKTTLANRVFNNQKVVAHFDSYAWITVSQSYTVEELMKNLAHQLCKGKGEDPRQDVSQMDRNSLIYEVRNVLQQKRYVVIFDDVWSVEFWGQIEHAMFDNRNGSRILITTRMHDVVESCKRSPFDQVYKLKPLTFEKSIELFCKKAFLFEYNGCCPNHLMNISSEIVKKCKGLPLAIVAIGGLLSHKEKTTFEWEKIRQSLSSEMEKNPHLIGITKILGLSYDDLPYYLKSCLLYFGIYPKDYQVKSKRLIRQWIAEGFVKDEEGKNLEDVAEQYLSELIGRSLVQVSSFTTDGKAKRCHVHDLFRDIILRKCKDLCFCQHISKEDELGSSAMIRHLSIAISPNDLIGSTKSSHTRSLHVFLGKDSELTNEFVHKIPKIYRLLKVLDLEDANDLNFDLRKWENLAHLKYLCLKGNSILSGFYLKFIGKFQNLETLDIRGEYTRNIPEEICKLTKLRHLLGYGMIFTLKNDLGGLTTLQTLNQVNITYGGEKLLRELGKLKQLRNLGLVGLKEGLENTLCSSINEMHNLEKLHIKARPEFGLKGISVINFPAISSLPMLRKLRLEGMLHKHKLPEWVSQLQNLVKLSLVFSQLTHDPLQSLQNMPHLLFLYIGPNAYEGESLCFQNGGFQRLKELRLKYLFNLNSIVFHKGALCSLKTLELSTIPKLKTVHRSIQHLEKLEVLNLFGMPREFEQCIAPHGRAEHPSIQHVPIVKITGYLR